MNQIIQRLKNNHSTVSTGSFLLMMLIAFGFSVAARYIWIAWAGDFPGFFWQDRLMINTNDGYYWVEGARDLLAGGHQPNDLSPVNYPLSQLTAALARLLPVHIETLIMWMPALFGALLVVPIMLIGRLFRLDIVGFIAALAGGITWSYYNRTMAGYYDTDMLIVVLPAMTVWGAMYALKYQKTPHLLYAPIFAIVSIYWHNGTINIINGLFFVTLLYTLVFERKNLYFYQFLTLYVIALTTLPVWLKIVLVGALAGIFILLKEKMNDRLMIALALVSAAIYLIFGGWEWFHNILNNVYFTRGAASDELNNSQSLKFYGVVNTVREAGHIPFEIFADRIGGSVLSFVAGVIGYILLLFRERLFLLSLPMVGLGFFALQGGLRFTVFAVPFIALGAAFLLYLVVHYLVSFADEGVRSRAEKILLLFAVVLLLYPNISHIIGYKVPTVFTKEEVAVLDRLKKIAHREDYVVSWWDYGYPVRYYSDVKTLIDGGKHTGEDNFPVSFILTHDQVSAANMARLDVEFTERSFDTNKTTPITAMLAKYADNDPDRFFEILHSKSMRLPAKTRDVFLYLPDRMLNIFPTIALFSNIDLKSGLQKGNPFFYVARHIRQNNNLVDFGNGIVLDRQKGVLQIGRQVVTVKNFVVTAYDKSGKLVKNVQELHSEGPVSIVFMQSYGQFLIMDEQMYNSLYIQLFVLEQYDPELYEPVILTPMAKVYKLKR